MENRQKTTSQGGDRGGFQGCDLPEWFLFELLCKLPAEDVFRFKRVSKQWSFFISDPRYSGSLLSRLSLSSRRLIFLRSKYNLDDDDDGGGDEKGRLTYPERHFFSLPTPPPGGIDPTRTTTTTFRTTTTFTEKVTTRSLYTIAADKGFVLMVLLWKTKRLNGSTKFDLCNFYVCSATTDQWLSIPVPPYTHDNFQGKYFYDLRPRIGFVTRMQVEEAGPVLSSYKVVILTCSSFRHDGEDFFDMVEVFSSETRRWENFTLSYGGGGIPTWFYSKTPIVVNNSLYYSARCNDDDEPYQILAYNPYFSPTECRMIKVPPGGSFHRMGVCQGRLRYFQRQRQFPNQNQRDEECLEVWEFGEEEDLSQWRLKNTLTLARDVATFFYFHPFDSNVIICWGEDDFVAFNMLTHKMETFTPSPNKSKGFLLKLPPRPVSIPSSLIRSKEGEI